jgi:hypothetical protein
LEGVSLEMPRGWSLGLNVLVRVNGGKPLGMTEWGRHAQHAKAALYPHGTWSCFVARFLHVYRCVGININERR